ncbi:MAG TPA: MarR family transcriptional regulator [Anaerolineales bacterium]
MTKPDPFSKSVHDFMDVFMQRSMHGWSHFVKSTGLSMQQFSILMQLHYRSQCGISAISERFEISNAAASQLADKLVQSGLIERVESPEDRRAKLLTLSAKGKNLIERGVEERYRWMDKLAVEMNEQDQKKVTNALIILTEAARKLEQT